MIRRRFVMIKGDLYAVRSILSIRRTTPSMGVDKVSRNLVIRVTPETIGAIENSKYCSVWTNAEESPDLMKFIEEEISVKPND